MNRLIIPCVLALTVFAGCLSSYDSGGSSRSVGYRPGYVSFDLECLPQLVEGKTGVEVYIRMLAPTLAWLKVDAGFEAQVLAQVRVFDEHGESQIAELAWPETVRVATYAETQDHAPFRLHRLVPLAPGRYKFKVLLEDRGTGKLAERVVATTIARVQEGEPMLGGLVLTRTVPGAEPEPVVGFQVPLSRDTLHVRAAVLNVPAGTRLDVRFTICRFVADTVRAGLPYFFMPSMPAMEGTRLYPQRIDTVYSMREFRPLGANGYVLDDVLPPLERGVYQLALSVWGPGQEAREDSAAGAIKYFVGFGPAFPRPVLLKDLVDGCGYIARPNEQAAMDTITAPQAMRAAFDRFWLSLIPDSRRATAVMRTYFSRIEEANRMFSSYKEGWRTDRGMVYVIIGPPVRVEKRMETELWYYALPGSYQESAFEFRRVYFTKANLTIEDYLMRRNPLYQSTWEYMVKKWRDGEVY